MLEDIPKMLPTVDPNHPLLVAVSAVRDLGSLLMIATKVGKMRMVSFFGEYVCRVLNPACLTFLIYYSIDFISGVSLMPS